MFKSASGKPRSSSRHKQFGWRRLVSALVISAGSAGFAHADELRGPTRAETLDACITALDAQKGGWCEIRVTKEDPSISSVWPIDLDDKTRMVTGPKSVLKAWNGAAFDAQRLLLYFMGGGHADYGGNEVYQFDLMSGTWTRLTNPSPLDHLFRAREGTGSEAPRYCWSPNLDRVPGSTHTYDGLQFSRRTGTIFLVIARAANGACFNDEERAFDDDPRVFGGGWRGSGIYEFNPSPVEPRHGLPPLTWRRLPVKDIFPFPRTVELPDGSMIISSSTATQIFDPITGTVGARLWETADYGDGLSVYHPQGAVLSLHARTLLVRSLSGSQVRKIDVPRFHGKSLAVDKDGTAYLWNGRSRILTLNLSDADSVWRLYDWHGAGPSSGDHRVYSKWQYLEDHDVFVGLSSHSTGVWIYQQPDTMEPMEIATLDIQALVDAALPGATVSIPAGIYGTGLRIEQPLTVNLKGARLWGVVQGKGIVNVRCNHCRVIIENFVAEGDRAGCMRENCAGIKAEGEGFDLTVRHSHIHHTANGILTDNRGGNLVVEDSLIENTGASRSGGALSHGIYAGLIDRLQVRRSTVRNVNGDGHIVKSRAATTKLSDAHVLGGQSFHSRSIDLPCGGELGIERSIIQHSENTDNPDVIALGTEPANCDEIRSSTVSIERSWIIVDRDRSQDERARTYGSNTLFRWHGPASGAHLSGNRIVNVEEWVTQDSHPSAVNIPELAPSNTMCPTRQNCGLERYELPRM